MSRRSRGIWTRSIPMVEERRQVDVPLRLGVVGDTHMSPTRPRRSFEAVLDVLRRANVNLILHAGDTGHASVLRDLEEIAPVAAVRGNADPVELIEALPDRVWIDAGSRQILLLHGHHGKTAKQAARAAAGPGIDLIVFGHSHQPLIDREGSTLLFNPGSPVERRWNPHFGFGLIDVSETEIEPDLILFDDPAHLKNISP